MTQITLYNTRTRRKEPFRPLDWRGDAVPEAERRVRMYVCGPTVYDRAHLGNARAVVVFDMLYRLLRQVYGPERVIYARNFTDVDDKINARAQETGRPISDITAETTQWFLDDMTALGALEPDEMPRATAYIPQMIAMIEELIAGGHAYDAEGHVLFRVRSYSDYGKLSGRSVDDMIAGARVEVAPYKEDPLDFVLWKPSAPDLPGWDSPWGRGRPGWHIECSAMSHDLFGETFDIHGGGNDLIFPHHENEIAQSRCAHPEGGFAEIWMHNEMLQVEGRKMSKSLGNFFTVRDLLDQGVPGEVIRFVMLGTHYRKPMDWTEKKREEAENELRKWRDIEGAAKATTPPSKFVSVLANDLNTPGAISELRKLAKEITALDRVNPNRQRLVGEFLAAAQLMGLLEDSYETGGWVLDIEAQKQIENAPEYELVEELIARRLQARKEKDFATSDRIRDALVDAGITIKDTPEGAEWERGSNFDPAKLEALK